MNRVRFELDTYLKKALSVHTAPVTKISTHWCYLLEIDFAIRQIDFAIWPYGISPFTILPLRHTANRFHHIYRKSISPYGNRFRHTWTEDAAWRNRFPLNNINACWFLLLVQCAQTVLKFFVVLESFCNPLHGRTRSRGRCWAANRLSPSSRTVRPRSPRVGRWIGVWRTTGSTVYSSAPRSQAAEVPCRICAGRSEKAWHWCGGP